jgi:hypothetical protein
MYFIIIILKEMINLLISNSHLSVFFHSVARPFVSKPATAAAA